MRLVARLLIVSLLISLSLLGIARLWAKVLPARFQSIIYLINSPKDFSARDIIIHDPNTGISALLLHRPTLFSELAIAADGQAIIFNEPFVGIYRSDLDGQNARRLLSGYVGNPLWSPDGESLLYSDSESVRLFHFDTGNNEVLMSLRAGVAWMPDSLSFVYSEFNQESRHYEILSRSLLDASTESLLSSDEIIVQLNFSPDGRFLAYGFLTGQIHLHELATGTETMIRDYANHYAPHWSRDGEYLVFLRNVPRSPVIELAIANRNGEILYRYAPRGLTLESSVLWMP